MTQGATFPENEDVVAFGWKNEMLILLVSKLDMCKKELGKDPPSSLQISSKIRYQKTKPNGCLRRSTGIAIHCEYQPNQISEPCNQGPF